MDGTDPTTTIPGATGGGHLGLIIILALIGIFAASVGVRMFMRSLSRPGQTGKAISGGVCAAGTFSFALLAFVAGSSVGGVLLVLATVGFVSYTIPWVRTSVRGLVSDALASSHHKPPTQPPDRVSHV
jgi:hypothetical protein